MTDNLKIWDTLGKTDPKHTKPFSRAGGFKGTAMKPIWIIRLMTEHFGPVGIGWGIEKPEFQVIEADKERLVYCTVGVWHTSKTNLFYGVGGDKVTAARQSGTFNSDEAFKMAYTDAVNNALKYLGVGADIHMGQFDDSKYVEEVGREFEAPIDRINAGHVEAIRILQRKANCPEATICKNMGIDKLEDLPVEKYQFVIDKLNITIANKETKND